MRADFVRALGFTNTGPLARPRTDWEHVVRDALGELESEHRVHRSLRGLDPAEVRYRSTLAGELRALLEAIESSPVREG